MDLECTPRYQKAKDFVSAKDQVFITRIPATMRNPRTEDRAAVKISTVKEEVRDDNLTEEDLMNQAEDLVRDNIRIQCERVDDK
jgi:hypothetical protein